MMLFAKLDSELKKILLHLFSITMLIIYSLLPENLNNAVLLLITLVVCFFDFTMSFVTNCKMNLQIMHLGLETIFRSIAQVLKITRLGKISYIMIGFALMSSVFQFQVCVNALLVVLSCDVALFILGIDTSKGFATKKLIWSFAFFTTSMFVSVCYLEFFGYLYHFMPLFFGAIVTTFFEFCTTKITKLRTYYYFLAPIAFGTLVTLTEMLLN